MQQLISQSPQLAHIVRTLPMIASSDASVLICGETGTGKELLANLIHLESRRNAQPLFKINCAALPDYDVVGDLFGTCDEQGNLKHAGRLLAADGATVLLDEVDALPLSVQGKVLRFLESGECQLPGSHQLFHADVRIIAATSADLNKAVTEQRFRSDLFYRLQVVPIELPPLRERSDDVALLLRHFNQQFCGDNAVVRLNKEVQHCLANYSWPGNVRELINFCQRMALLNPGKLMQLSDLPEQMLAQQQVSAYDFKIPPNGIKLAQVELDLIQQALEMAAGNRSRAARILGISRDTLLYRIQKYAL